MPLDDYGAANLSLWALFLLPIKRAKKHDPVSDNLRVYVKKGRATVYRTIKLIG